MYTSDNSNKYIQGYNNNIWGQYINYNNADDDYDKLLSNTINKIVIKINKKKIEIRININNIYYFMYYNHNKKFNNKIFMSYKNLAINCISLKNISHNICNDYIKNNFKYYEIKIINNSLKYFYNYDL